MKNKCAAGLFTIAVVMMISGCGAGNVPEPVPPVVVNRTYEKVDPSPAAAAACGRSILRCIWEGAARTGIRI